MVSNVEYGMDAADTEFKRRLAAANADPYVTKASKALAQQMESSIVELLAELMPGAALDEIRRRCQLSRFGGDPGEFFEVDGLPRLYFGPLVFTNEQQQDRYIVRASREVRRLV